MTTKEPLFEIIDSITNKRSLNLSREFIEKEYVPFTVNRFLGSHRDCIAYVNEMNKNCHLEKYAQYRFLHQLIRKTFRKVNWPKASKSEELELIQKFYGYSKQKAIQVLPLFTPERLMEMAKSFDTGGTSK